MHTERNRVLTERSRVLTERSRVLTKRSPVLTKRSRVHTERSRGGELYKVDYRLGFAGRANAPSVSNRVVSASLYEQTPQVYRTESSRLRSTSKRPKCIEQSRLGFARRAVCGAEDLLL